MRWLSSSLFLVLFCVELISAKSTLSSFHHSGHDRFPRFARPRKKEREPECKRREASQSGHDLTRRSPKYTRTHHLFHAILHPCKKGFAPDLPLFLCSPKTPPFETHSPLTIIRDDRGTYTPVPPSNHDNTSSPIHDSGKCRVVSLAFVFFTFGWLSGKRPARHPRGCIRRSGRSDRGAS